MSSRPTMPSVLPNEHRTAGLSSRSLAFAALICRTGREREADPFATSRQEIRGNCTASVTASERSVGLLGHCHKATHDTDQTMTEISFIFVDGTSHLRGSCCQFLTIRTAALVDSGCRTNRIERIRKKIQAKLIGVYRPMPAQRPRDAINGPTSTRKQSRTSDPAMPSCGISTNRRTKT